MTNGLTATAVRSLALAAVHDELMEYGYRAMTMPSLAARAGVNEQALRNVFVSRESVLVAHLDRMTQCMLGLLRAIAGSGAPVTVRLRELLLTRVVFRFDVLRPYSAHLEDMRDVVLLAIRRRRPVSVEKEAYILERVLAEGERAALIPLADPAPLARTLLVATHALLPAEGNLIPLPERRELSRTAGGLIDVVLEGVLRTNWTAFRHESPRIDATAL